MGNEVNRLKMAVLSIGILIVAVVAMAISTPAKAQTTTVEAEVDTSPIVQSVSEVIQPELASLSRELDLLKARVALLESVPTPSPDPDPQPAPIPLPDGFIHGMNVESKWAWDYDKNPTKAEHLKPFSLIRCMKWTNSGDMEGTARSVRLANALGADLWVTMDFRKGDASMREHLQYIRTHYTVPGGRIWVEPGNEVWNAVEGYEDEVMEWAGVPNRDNGENNSKFIAEWGEQAKRCWKLAREIIPDCVRVLGVKSSGAGWLGDRLFAAVDDTDYEVVSPAFYVANSASGNIDSIMQAAIADASPGSRDYENVEWWTDEAHKRGKKCVLYELQQHTNHRSAGSEALAIEAMSRDPRGADVVRRMLLSMTEIGVDGACWFAAFKEPDKYPFGLYGTPKWQPIVEAAEQ